MDIERLKRGEGKISGTREWAAAGSPRRTCLSLSIVGAVWSSTAAMVIAADGSSVACSWAAAGTRECERRRARRRAWGSKPDHEDLR